MTDTTPPADVSVLKISAAGLETHYRQTGSGPHLVLVHGMNGSLADWQLRIAAGLSDRFTVLTYDLRGHGYTDMPPSGYTSADMAGDLLGLLDALGIDRAHVAGHSIGGTIALHFAALHPDRVLALTVSDMRIRTLQSAQKLKDWKFWPRWKEQLDKQGLSLNEESELDFSLLEALMSQRSGQAQREFAGQRAEHWKHLLESTTARADLADPAGLTPELIGRIPIPVQGLFAEVSFCLPTLAALRELLPDMQWAILPGVGHLFPVTRPELFIEHVRTFHTSHPAPREVLPVPPESGQSTML